MIKVVHCKDENEKDHIYLGRPHPLGNPYTHKEGTTAPFVVGSRDEAVDLYEKWLLSQIKIGNQEVLMALSELKALALQNDIKLGCWCFPKRCHCDVVKKYVELSLEQLKRRKAENQTAYMMMGLFSHRVLDKKGNYHYFDKNEVVPKAGFVSESNTFIQDVEGKPIFEGDEVQFLMPNEEKEWVIGEVKYIKGKLIEKGVYQIVYKDGTFEPLIEDMLLIVKGSVSQGATEAVIKDKDRELVLA